MDRNGNYIAILIIEGKGERVKNAKVILLSTMLNCAYDFGEHEFPTHNLAKGGFLEYEIPLEWKKFVRSAEYRAKIVLEKGTLVKTMPEIDPKGFFSMVVEHWTRFEARGDKSQVFYSPLTEKMLEQVLAINPQYSLTQKFIGRARAAIPIPPDPIAFFLGMALDVYRVYKFPPTGWDYTSELPSRRNRALAIDFVSVMFRRRIKELNYENTFLKQQNEILLRNLGGRRK